MTLNLDLREKIALALGLLATVLVVILAVYVPMGPRRGFQASQQELDMLKGELELQYLFRLDEEERLQKQKALMEILDKRTPDFSLFTHVDNLLTATDLRARAQLEQYRPRNVSDRQPMVRLRLQNVATKELVDFLHKIYDGDNLVAVYKLDYLRPAANERGLDCDVTFVTLTL